MALKVVTMARRHFIPVTDMDRGRFSRTRLVPFERLNVRVANPHPRWRHPLSRRTAGDASIRSSRGRTNLHSAGAYSALHKAHRVPNRCPRVFPPNLDLACFTSWMRPRVR